MHATETNKTTPRATYVLYIVYNRNSCKCKRTNAQHIENFMGKNSAKEENEMKKLKNAHVKSWMWPN